MHEINSIVVAVSLIPVIGTAILCSLAFYRIGYGRIGITKSMAFSVLIIPLVIELSNIDDDVYLQFVGNTSRLIGFTALAFAFLWMYLEADRSIP